MKVLDMKTLGINHENEKHDSVVYIYAYNIYLVEVKVFQGFNRTSKYRWTKYE